VGCNSQSDVLFVEPTAAPQDKFFVTWDIQSQTVGPLTCAEAGATRVDMDVVNLDTAERLVFSFDCDAHQGLSGGVTIGRLDVVLNLLDPSEAILSQVDLGVQSQSQALTVDLGQVLFQVP
jgi:hypothetical protein